ncbi:hypothetical protein [Maridesulfovibrio frigidus]|uniref:hypothetical protein n=1 Tax=Maridesulfovibrio frigidus TaxID=340956 RepID=UPI0012EBB218|nr:hypothetical protein [Maridesulfovibrio frigidus]
MRPTIVLGEKNLECPDCDGTGHGPNSSQCEKCGGDGNLCEYCTDEPCNDIDGGHCPKYDN